MQRWHDLHGTGGPGLQRLHDLQGEGGQAMQRLQGEGGQGLQDPQGLQRGVGRLKILRGGGQVLHGLQHTGLHGLQGRLDLHGTDRHGNGPHGFLHPFGLHGEGRQTIILHCEGRQGDGTHGTEQGVPHGGLEGGGVHSNISSFLANGAPVILRITSSNTPRRGLVIVVIFTGAFSCPDEASIHLGP